MPRAQRLEDVGCAICMESLFNKLDDLDEVCPIATAECGHVFHEDCLLRWFKIQSTQYLAQAREQYQNFSPSRARSPSISDAPAECPKCRAECYANPETGEPAVHRLYIDFGTRMEAESSQMGSSPVKMSMGKGKGKGKETEGDLDGGVLGFARRAKAIGVEVEGLGADSKTEQVEGMIKKVDTLEEDMVSVKRLAGIKTYLGGLAVALNNLRSTLQTHPLTATLQAELEESRRMCREQTKLLRSIPGQIAHGVETERLRGDRRVKKMSEEGDVIRRELQKIQVARVTERKAIEERERRAENRVSDMQQELATEAVAREDTQARLDERTKQLRGYQAKNERSQDLKVQIKALQAENDRLKGAVDRHSTVLRSEARARRSPTFDDDDPELDDALDENDLSIQEIPESLYRAAQQPSDSSRHQRLPHRSTIAADESLQVDYPSFNDDSAIFSTVIRDRLPAETTSGLAPVGRSLTARTISCNLDEPRGKKRRPSGTKSKYFSSENDDILPDSEEEEGDIEVEEDVIVPGSSSPIQPHPYIRPRINPFATTKEASDMRKKLPACGQDHPRRQALGTIDMTSPSGRPAVIYGKVPRPVKDIGDWLGIKDAQGRPKKGLALGQKMKRRA